MNFYQVIVLLALAAIAAKVCARTGYGPGDQDWGFVDVRKGVHMFYWLYYTTAKVIDYTDRPLVIWLEDGSSTCYGNFEQIGPLDRYGNYRNWTWVKDMNVLFIDNPVGMGFSYYNRRQYLPSNNTEIALDLVRLMQSFYNMYPEFVKVPLHIFGEGYGGKMAAEFALELYYANQRNEIKCNLSSVILSNPWISPIESMLAWAPLLFNIGIVDRNGHDKIAAAAYKSLKLVLNGYWRQAAEQCKATQLLLISESKGVDFFNVQKLTRGEAYTGTSLKSNSHEDLSNDDRPLKLENFMRGPVTTALNIPSPIKWGHQSKFTFAHLIDDFMKPSTYIISELLDKTSLKVGVISGQWDLICATAGTVNWIEVMQWQFSHEYGQAPRLGIFLDGILEGYEKSAGNFTMFWVNRAGHMVTADNPSAMSYILKKFTNYG